GLAYFQSSFVADARSWVSPRRDGTIALLANAYDPAALVDVYLLPTILRDRLAPLARERHLSVFADEWSDWLGTPLAEHTRFSAPERCRGQIDSILAPPDPSRWTAGGWAWINSVASGSPDPNAWRVTGWAWDAKRETAPPRIVIADASGSVIGYALTALPGADVRDVGWRGHLVAASPAGI